MQVFQARRDDARAIEGTEARNPGATDDGGCVDPAVRHSDTGRAVVGQQYPVCLSRRSFRAA